MRISRRHTLLGGLSVSACAAAGTGSSAEPVSKIPGADDPRFEPLERVEPYVPYLERLAAYPWPRGRGSLETGDLPPTPEGVELVQYPSGAQSLSAWFVPGRREGPTIVYLHNDFALRALAFENARPVIETGLPLLIPTFRGENGNRGDFDLLLGQVQDTKAAITWLSAQAGVGRNDIHVIGHSIGGGVAALLALHDDVPVVSTASIGGIYRARTFSSWAASKDNRDLVHFDPLDAAQVSLRILGPNVRDLKRPHVAYAGSEDRFARVYSQHVLDRAQPFGAPFSRQIVKGGHMASALPAVLNLLSRLLADAPRS